MDIVGAAANIIAIIDLAAKVFSQVYAYSTSAHDAPKTITMLLHELSSTNRVLTGLRLLPSSSLSRVEDTVLECKATLEQMLTRLEGDRGSTLQMALGKRLKWPLREKDVLAYVESLGRYKATFTLALSSDSVMMIAEVKESLDEIRAAQVENSRDNAARLQDEKAKELMTWLSPLSFNTKHEATCRIRQNGTGEWIFDKKEYKRWESTPGERLWLHSTIPGSGKTVLTSNIIDRIQSSLAADHGFAYFYCDFRDSATTHPGNIVRTLLAQLIKGWTSSSTETFSDLFAKRKSGQAPPSTVEMLQELVSRASTLYDRCTIVLDGLDECEDREDLLGFLTELGSAPRKISVLVSSRREQDILDYLEDFSVIALKDEGRNLVEDMRMHIAKEFMNKKRWGRVRKEMMAEITDTLLKGSETNMFRWLQCQLDVLCKIKTNKGIREALQNLPNSLFETYERILHSIDRSDETSVDLAVKAFRWLVASVRPMVMTEVVEALALSEGDDTLDLDYTVNDGADLMAICSSLVDYNERHRTLSLSHYSVREFLTSDYLKNNPALKHYAVSISEAQKSLATLTVTYLLLGDFSDGPCESWDEMDEMMRAHQLYRYCAEHWSSHIRLLPEDDGDDLFSLLSSFLFDSPQKFDFFQLVLHLTNPYYHVFPEDVWKQYPRPTPSPPLYYTIDSNLLWVTKRILNVRPELLDTEVGTHGTPLLIATLAGHKDMVCLLLGLGADLHKPSHNYHMPSISPLWAAVYKRELEIFNIFIDYGADVNRRHGVLQQHLIHVAAASLDASILSRLLALGIDPDTRMADGSTGLHHAVSAAGVDTVRVLVGAGADVAAVTHAWKTPVHLALELRDEPILRVLLGGLSDLPAFFSGFKDKSVLSWVLGKPWFSDIDVTPVVGEREYTFHDGDSIRKMLTLLRLSERMVDSVTDYAEVWVKTTHVRQEEVTMWERKVVPPYLIVAVHGRGLRRIEFQMCSHDQGWSSDPDHKGSYEASHTWFEARLSNKNGKERADVPARVIQRNVHASREWRVHTVVWDIRDPTPGVREWLEMARPGEVVLVYAMAQYSGWANHVAWVSVEAFWGW